MSLTGDQQLGVESDSGAGSAPSRSPASSQSDEPARRTTSGELADAEELELRRLVCARELHAASPAASDASAKTASCEPSAAETEAEPARERPVVELRLLVRRREAGAIIGKRGANIKRLREQFRSSMFSIPDTGNGPERIVCVVTGEQTLDAILADITRLLLEKSPENDEQIELKLLIHSSHAGSIIGLGGQSIKKLRNDSKAAIKIYEMCCPLSTERVCAIKARPPLVVSTVKLIHSILRENPVKGAAKPYDALYFDLSLVDKYGGYLPEDAAPSLALPGHAHRLERLALGRQLQEASGYLMSEWASAPDRPLTRAESYSVWRAPDYKGGRAPNQADPSEPKPAPDAASPPDAQRGDRSSPAKQSGHPRPIPAADHALARAPIGAHLARPSASVRYHPYASLLSDQMSFLAQASAVDRQLMARSQHLPLIGASAGHASAYQRALHYGHQHQAAISPHLLDLPLAGIRYPLPVPVSGGCGHARPCLCMLLPMGGEMLAADPYVQLGKNLTHLRNPAHSYKKK